MCVFCNQRSISGKREFDINSVDMEIKEALSTINSDNCCAEIAYFGGSFTGIPRDTMISLLKIAHKYVENGVVSSLRCSTRPDYINEEILEILKKYDMQTIELGLQSSSDRVLSESKRGHDFECEKRACKMIIDGGFNLIGQMMIGLPGSSLCDEVATAEFICDTGACGARIYPTVVFNDSELKVMCETGKYKPLGIDDAVFRTKEVMKVFIRRNVNIIRVGLCSSENMVSDKTYYAGPNHVAIRELCEGELYFEKIIERIEEFKINNEETDFKNKILNIYAPRGEMSKVSGQNRRNKQKIQEKYGFANIVIHEKQQPKYHLAVEIKTRS